MNLRTAARKAYKGTDVAELDALRAELSKWTRRETIAQNKLVAVRQKIVALANRLACEKINIKPEERL